jgi:hypothetical protein
MTNTERKLEEFKKSIRSCTICKKHNNCEIQKEKNDYDIRCCMKQEINIFDFINEDTEVEILGFYEPISSCVYFKEICKIKDCYEILLKEKNRLINENIIKNEGHRDFSIILYNHNFSTEHRTGYFIIASFVTTNDELDFLNYDENDKEKLVKLFHTENINFYQSK